MPAQLVYEKIGALIKKYRRDSRMTQQDLAKRVGMSRGSISNIENGFQRIYPHQLYLFSKYLSSEDKKIYPADLLPDIREEQMEEISGYKIEVWGGKDKAKSKEIDRSLLYTISDIREKALQEREKHVSQGPSGKSVQKTKNKGR